MDARRRDELMRLAIDLGLEYRRALRAVQPLVPGLSAETAFRLGSFFGATENLLRTLGQLTLPEVRAIDEELRS